MKLAILEDNAERRDEMQRVLTASGIDLQSEFFPSAPSFVTWARDNLSQAALISLDHDLEPEPPLSGDPGTGRDVADWLAQQSLRIPVIIHSSNTNAAIGMECALEDAAFKTGRVSPYDDLRWIGEEWIEKVSEMTKD